MPANDLFDIKDPFGLPPAPKDAEQRVNAPPEYTVSELSQRLKRTVEENYSFVRVRGELSRVTVAKSGHLYTDLKDTEAVLNAICWKGTLGRLDIKPEEGMDVVCTGRLTTYPGRSNYQLIIETMELAGQGALLKMLEERKKKLAAEGLFDPTRKKKIPFLPGTIGVITSPTGAVIRDIMHRLSERFPRRVLIWPVAVQGQGAAQQVADAIAGFNSLPEGAAERPDVLIVARGGGSLEDLMPFNDELVVRAAAASAIPLISAVGHETDTTLIDFAADLRAPTPTAAAEKAVPVRTEILARVLEHEKRMLLAVDRLLRHLRTHMEGLTRGLPDPRRLMESAMQRLDHLSARLEGGLGAWIDRRGSHLRELGARLSSRALTDKIAQTGKILGGFSERLKNAATRHVADKRKRLDSLALLLDSLSFKRVLERGYAAVYDREGKIISTAARARGESEAVLRFHDGTVKADIKEN